MSSDTDKTPTPADDDGTNDQNSAPQRSRRRKRKRKRASAAATETKPETKITPTSETTANDTSTSRTIFVEGIPFSSNREELVALFAENSITDIVDVRLPKWQDSGRLRGFGHVEFASESSYHEALKLTKKCYLQNRYLSIQAAKEKVAAVPTEDLLSNPCPTILLKNLDYGATEQDIQDAMERFGTIVSGGVRIVRNYKTHESKGFAYVEYESVESAKSAMEYHMKNAGKASALRILDRTCRLDYDNAGGRVKGSFKTSTGRLWTKEYKKNKLAE